MATYRDEGDVIKYKEDFNIVEVFEFDDEDEDIDPIFLGYKPEYSNHKDLIYTDVEEFYPDKEDCKDIINEEIRLKEAEKKEIQETERSLWYQ